MIVCIFHLIYEAEPAGQPMTRVLVSMNACVPKYMDAKRHQYKILDFSILDAENLVIVFRHTSRHPEGCGCFNTYYQACVEIAFSSPFLGSSSL
jgi:hypothetical protein